MRRMTGDAEDHCGGGDSLTSDKSGKERVCAIKVGRKNRSDPFDSCSFRWPLFPTQRIVFATSAHHTSETIELLLRAPNLSPSPVVLSRRERPLCDCEMTVAPWFYRRSSSEVAGAWGLGLGGFDASFPSTPICDSYH